MAVPVPTGFRALVCFGVPVFSMPVPAYYFPVPAVFFPVRFLAVLFLAVAFFPLLFFRFALFFLAGGSCVPVKVIGMGSGISSVAKGSPPSSGSKASTPSTTVHVAAYGTSKSSSAKTWLRSGWEQIATGSRRFRGGGRSGAPHSGQGVAIGSDHTANSSFG